MNIEEKIRDFILKNLYYTDNADFTDDVSFLAEGIMDSTKATSSMAPIELVAFVESEFRIKVEMAEVVVKNFDSIRKMAAFVRRKLGLADSACEVVSQLSPPVRPSRPPGELEPA